MTHPEVGTIAGLPPEMFTRGNVTPPDSLYEDLAAEFPDEVYRDETGSWVIELWAEPGRFSAAIKALYARSGHEEPQ